VPTYAVDRPAHPNAPLPALRQGPVVFRGPSSFLPNAVSRTPPFVLRMCVNSDDPGRMCATRNTKRHGRTSC
jgi:hypothetical protein